MDRDSIVPLLKEEYVLLQRFYEDFDSRVITIKGWSATVALAAIGGGFWQSRYLWLFAAGASLIFWFLEGLWKSFQYLYSPRIRQIEETFQSGRFNDIAPLQIYGSWMREFHQSGFQLRQRLRMGIVWFPHLLTLAAGLILFILSFYVRMTR